MKDLKQSAIQFLFSANPDDRDRGDDLGIVFYGIAWMYYGAIMVLTQDPAVISAMQFYIWFDLLCIIFLVLHLWRSPTKQLRLPTKIMWIKVIPLVFIMLLILYLLSFAFYAAYPGSMIDIQYLLFGYLRIISIEEIAFRGLAIELFLLFEPRNAHAFSSNEDKTAWGYLDENKLFLIGAITSSLLFGILHYRAYNYAIAPILYLTTLGFMLAFLRFKYGLFASMMLHALNNMFAGAIMAILFIMHFIH